jgi:hypothetical protein
MTKLYIIVRADLPAGAQCAQSCHALRAFIDAYPALDQAWHSGSNNIVILQTPSENSS